MDTLIEKVKFCFKHVIRNTENKLSIPVDFIELFYYDDPELGIILEKVRKTVDLTNDAEERNDDDFLNRDFETDIWFII
jgi:hypothetical protein